MVSDGTPPRPGGSRRAAAAAPDGPAGPSTKGKRGSAKPATIGSSRRGKYNASGERVNGIWMASAAQAQRFRQLLKMDTEGRIGNLRTEVTFALTVNNQLICRYRADFTYDVLGPTGAIERQVIEDVKGMVTPEFTLKRKLFDALIEPKLSVIKHNGAGAKHLEKFDREWAGRIPDK